MRVVLMNKNIKVLEADYNESSKSFDNIVEVYNIDYAPYILKSFYIPNDINNTAFKTNLVEWFKSRGIPSWRDELDVLLQRLHIGASSELLDKAFGLSLSDNYWIKPSDLNINYDDINFFDHDFDYREFLEASLSFNSSGVTNDISLKTPNNTTDGMLKKAWVIEGGVRYLLKGGYKKEFLQPFNEVLASMICERLGFDYVLYTLDVYNNLVVSKCPCFINKDTELIMAYQIKNNMKRYNSILDYEDYIRVLEEKGIKDARIKLENMFILDFIIKNEDRHLNNFGVIRNVETLEWLDVAPIFDSGMSLNNDYYLWDELVMNGNGRFFYEAKPFDEIIKIVENPSRIDIDKLDGIVEEYATLLHNYQNITHISDDRIQRLCILLDRQINKLKEIILNSKTDNTKGRCKTLLKN